MTAYAELAVTSNFCFLRGGSHPEELVPAAVKLGLAGIAFADRNSLAGVVRGHVAAKEAGMPYAVGCRLVFRDGTPDILAWPTDRNAYGRLCRLLTTGNRRAEKGDCHLDLADLLEWGEGLILGVMPDYGTALQSASLMVDERGAALFTAHSREGGNPGHVRMPLAKTGSSLSRERAVEGFAKPPFERSGGDRKHLSVVPERPNNPLAITLAILVDAFPRNVRLMVRRQYGPGDHRQLAALARLARRYSVPLMATNDVLYHIAERRPLQDVITCIREHKTLATAGRLLEANAERYLKDAAEMARLFADYPEAVAETRAVFQRLGFSLDELKYQYPDEPTGDAATPQEALEQLTEAGLATRYPGGVPRKVRDLVAHELKLIAELKYAPYFLTVHDIMRYAQEQEILAQGRGSAANSAVCYVLGITEVDPERVDLLFERFVSAERNEPPDIDVDFEHERREEVMQYIYEKYGRHRAGLAATVITYRTRSAVREVGKVFGLSEDTIGALSGTIWGWSNNGVRDADIRRIGLDPEERTMHQVMVLSEQLIGFPRHLSQHVGGFVMTRDRLDEMVPVMNAAMEDRTNVEWDKDDLDALNMLKVDVLALGMLSCIRRAFDFMERHYGERPTLASIPDKDQAVYRMLGRADSLGVFQVESRAQMSMLPRLKPANFYDLVIEVAIVRPGPIQGDMVHPYLRRRQGLETVNYPKPRHGDKNELKQVLGRTLGVPLFQEQAMKIAIVAAGFTPGEADRLRRAMATFRRVGTIGTFQKKMVEGMTARGYERDFAERCFRQIEGFGDYGFPESHAASFALLVYASSWLKCHYPDVFCAALLNAQPMGFYAPAQIVRDAARHGVTIRPPDINFSDWDSTLEPEEGQPTDRIRTRVHAAHADQRDDIRSAHAVRLGLRQIKGIKEEDAEALMKARGAGFDSVRDLWLRSGLSRAAIERLADADAFRSLGLDRRDALWAARGLGSTAAADRPGGRLPLFDVAEHGALQREPDVALPPMPIGEHVVNDYRFLSLSLKAHPVSFLRRDLAARRIITNAALIDLALKDEATRGEEHRKRDREETRGAEGRSPDRDTRNPGEERSRVAARNRLWPDRGGTKIETPPARDRPRPAVKRRKPDRDGPNITRRPWSGPPPGRRVTVSGLVLVRQRPGTASGVIFMTIEDETDIANIIVWPRTFERFRPVVLGARLVAVTGRVQSESSVIHVVAEQLEDLTSMLAVLSEEAADPRSGEVVEALSRADEVRRPQVDMREKIGPRARSIRLAKETGNTDAYAKSAGKVMPKGRNFH
ncbi:error-prone DNA polymerase [Bauldia sp.]|uniref:error-prone DNA polymerase n=1 Tax=Bauldia sp. TaxID=2575872 RepID=UPI003BACB0D3